MENSELRKNYREVTVPTSDYAWGVVLSHAWKELLRSSALSPATRRFCRGAVRPAAAGEAKNP